MDRTSAEPTHFAPYKVSTTGRASAMSRPHIGMTTRDRPRSALVIAFFRRSASCLTRENAGRDTLLIIAPRRVDGHDATLKASTYVPSAIAPIRWPTSA